MYLTFTATGSNPSAEELKDLAQAVMPTAGMGRRIGVEAIRAIRKRTAAGFDAHGVPFVPYSPSYAAYKLTHGGGGIVNLYSVEAQNHMLDALAVMVNGVPGLSGDLEAEEPLVGEIGVGIYDDPVLEHRLQVHNEGQGRIPQRELLGLTDEDVVALETGIGQQIEARLERLI